MKKKNNRGFSLIELIIVIAIMAVLVAIIAPNLIKYLSSSKSETDTSNLHEVKQQVINAISDAQANNITVPTGTLFITGNGISVTVIGGDGDKFDDILQKSLEGSVTKSKVTPAKKCIKVIISGSTSAGYTITNVQFS